MLSVKNISKIYQSGFNKLTVLNNISFEVAPGETAAIVGPSGSGKTTLLGLCAGLDRYDAGSITLYDSLLSELDEDGLAQIRNQHVGFVFQNFQLLPTLTALENVMVPMELQGALNAKKKALALLDKVGLADRATHYASELSGGEQQRIALARAFSNNPKILFADEPTGNLDTETGQKVEQLLFNLNRDAGTTLVLVTHDLELANKTEHIIRLKGGVLV
ncbi:ABC transporter ATP-binding protein [Olivibacter domesticus]|uniref:Putative ABC transport system ATP-binding protein n=2 Tax=Olivibacter domesticus TaxID=407022 RepID=A0A1H7J5U5_OLID1|nr:ABC transporter ATP-binding protein [Olivibacter domesticus]SEK69976.1 putative ABC transport system ATP-binding protein [Olivibacter domesticus]